MFTERVGQKGGGRGGGEVGGTLHYIAWYETEPLHFSWGKCRSSQSWMRGSTQ